MNLKTRFRRGLGHTLPRAQGVDRDLHFADITAHLPASHVRECSDPGCRARARWSLKRRFGDSVELDTVVFACDQHLLTALGRAHVMSVAPLPDPRGLEAMSEAIDDDG